MTTMQTSLVPAHLGLILDGNRRWARQQGLPAFEGHRQGYENLKTIADHAFKQGVKFVSAYIFSTENWSRAKDEVDYLMNLALKIATQDAKELIENNIRVLVFGLEAHVPKRVLKALKKIQTDSSENNGGTLILCFNYGGQQEIVAAVKRIITHQLPVDEITQETISQNIYNPEVPPVDLVIRTSGEQRLSNFMLWRVAYAELYFTKLQWPEFTTHALDDALQDYQNRNRRFGGN